jgi:hypothetical protein
MAWAHSGPLVEARDVGLGVLLEIELAALPRHGWKDRRAGGTEAGMVIADDRLNPVEATFLEGGQEGSPVDPRLAQGGAEAEDRALSIQNDAGGDKDGPVDDLPPWRTFS